MTSPPPRRPDTRRSPRVRHGTAHDQWVKVQSFTRTALRAGAGDDVGALTSPAKRKRFMLDGRSLRLVAVFLTVLALSAVIAAFSSRSVEVSAIAPTSQATADRQAAGNPDENAFELQAMEPDSESEHVPPTSGADVESGDLDEGPVVVHVSGEVITPGVVTLTSPARVVDAVEAAGGATEAADLALVNLAQRIMDGSHIHIPAAGEGGMAGVVSGGNDGVAGGGTDGLSSPGDGTPGQPGTAQPGAGQAGARQAGEGGQAVNINTASQAELETIPGIGPVTAQAIMTWRETNGPFRSVEELIEVNGIGPKTLERLREYVRVS